jgi:hypothetical protein
MRISIIEALHSLRPGSHWVINGDYEYSNIDWKDDNTSLPTEEINTEIDRLQTIEYRYKRAPEYPNMADQLDMLWHAIDQNKLDTTSDFYQSLKAVKDKYPKDS